MTNSPEAAKGSTRRFPPFAAPTGSPEIPSIGEFLDELPSIVEFLAVDVGAQQEVADAVESLPAIDDFAPEEYDADGWAIAGWQSFDWASLGSLGRQSGRDAAEAGWTETEWAPEDEGAYGVTEGAYEFSDSTTNAHEVAAALNDIAERIRSGELAIDNLHGTPPEAAMAAALAALLRMRG